MINRILAIYVLLAGALAQASVVDYNKLSDRAVALLEKLVNAKPISGCESDIMPILEARLKELDLSYEIVLSGDVPVPAPPPVTDKDKKCLSGKDPAVGNRPNIIVRLKAAPATDRGAFMIMAHMDVVPAIGQTWSPGLEPHKMIKKEGFVFGRGTLDMLSYLTVALELMGEIKKAQTPLSRDLILMINSDEERGGINGVNWLVKNRPELFKNIEFAVSEGGGVITDDSGKPLFIGYEAAQKRYQDFKITAKGPTGHSSSPNRFQAANLMVEALEKIKLMKAPPRFIPLVKEYFHQRAKVETDMKLQKILAKLGKASAPDDKNLNKKFKAELDTLESDYPTVYALLHRTCTITVVAAGSDTAKNAQPQTATSYVNCRLMPDEKVEDLLPLFQSKINLVVGPNHDDPNAPSIKIEVDVDQSWGHAEASSITGVIPEALKKYGSGYFKGIPVIPSMLTGATDLRFLRKTGIKSYGIGPIFMSDSDRRRAHGIDERILLSNVHSGAEYFHQFVLDMVGTPSKAPASEKVFNGKTSKDFQDAFSNDEDHFHSADASH